MFNTLDIQQIKNANSKINFEAVLQSYYSGNYKASILLLYNLVVNDLYSKLQLMDEKGYVNCKADLDNIENLLKENNETKYSIVEDRIFEIYKNKNILNHSTLDLLNYFKKVRNKCAHPFFFKESDYSPLAEEVYLFMIKIYNEILIVDAFFKDPYQVMKVDIENYAFPALEANLLGVSSLEKDTEKVKKYFEIKYFKYMTEINFKKLFKSLIDMTLSKKNDEIQAEQYKHFLILNSMLEYLNFNGKISVLNNVYNWSKLNPEIVYDDDINPFTNKWYALTYLYKVLTYNKNFLNELKGSNEIVYEKVEKGLYNKSYLFIEFWTLFDYDINKAIEKLPKGIPWFNYYHIINNFSSTIDRENLLELIKTMMKKVPIYDGYDSASESLELFIRILSDVNPQYTQEQIVPIFEVINENRQFYDKNRSNRDSQVLKITKLGYDLSQYSNLMLF